MQLVLLVAHTPNGEAQHRYVAKKLAEEFPDELAAIIIATGINQGVLKKMRRWWVRYSAQQILSRLVSRGYRKVMGLDVKRQKTLNKVLFPQGDGGEMPRPDIIRFVPSHNGPECHALLREINPDIVAVYGTLIIGKKVIEASKRIINIHTGFSPVYRGSDTIFWPLHNRELEYVGVTVHRVEAGVDSGPILARGRPSLELGDDEDRLFAKAVQLGAKLMCQAIRRETVGSAKPLSQNLDEGREYRTIERSLAAEIKTRKRLQSGLIAEGRPAWSEEF